MKYVDLTVPINEQTPAYPGDPHISIEALATYKKDTYNDHKVCFGIHSSGTHIDAPWHMVENGRHLSELPIDRFIGRGRLITLKNSNFDLAAIKQVEIEEGDIVLFQTGMAGKFHQPEYYADDRPAMNEEIAHYLVERRIRMIGLDLCSPDLQPFPVHRILLGKEILIIENITNLDKLVGKDFTVYALPINLDLDGAPARVIAELKDD